MATTRIKPTIEITPSTETPPAVVANCIATISRGVRELRAGRLNDRAIVTLVHEACGVARRDIKAVINALESLEATYLKKRPT